MKRRTSLLPVAAAAVLLVAVICRVSLVELVDRTSFPAGFGYVLPAVPLLALFVVVSLLALAEGVWVRQPVRSGKPGALAVRGVPSGLPGNDRSVPGAGD